MSLQLVEPITDYLDMQADWHLVDSLMGGTAAMRAAGETYLPRFHTESAAEYRTRLQQSFLFAGFSQTIKTAVGKAFAKGCQIEDADPQIEEWLWDIDRMGHDHVTFARRWFELAMAKGVAHVLVDLPRISEEDAPRTLADEVGIRPYLTLVDPAELIGWRTAILNGRVVLTQLRRRQIVTREDGPYGERLVEQVVVYRAGFTLPSGRTEIETWENPDGNWTLLSTDIASYDDIPLVSLNLNPVGLGIMQATPPLLDLAWLNVAHWQSASDQRNILHFSRFPMLVLTGLPDPKQEVELGPNRAIKLPSGGSAAYLEPQGGAIASGRQDLLDLESQMALMGMQLYVPQPGQVTATQSAMDYSAMHSRLAAMVDGLKDALEWSLILLARQAGIDEARAGTVSMQTDFTTFPNGTDLAILIQATSLGMLSKPTLLAELQRRGVLAEDIDIDEELARASADESFGTFLPPLQEPPQESEDEEPSDEAAIP